MSSSVRYPSDSSDDFLSLFIEIRPGEGGDDAKSLARELAAMYLRHAQSLALKSDVIEESPSLISVAVSGPSRLVEPLLSESGGHRFQRVPPNERRGRVHTSSVTVAVMRAREERLFSLRDADILVMTSKASGPGGQHVNKTESAVVLRHIPTGVEARAASKSQHTNRRVARAVLEARVAALIEESRLLSERDERRRKVGSGQRADKIRTYRFQDDLVVCSDGRKYRLSSVKGALPWISH